MVLYLVKEVKELLGVLFCQRFCIRERATEFVASGRGDQGAG